MPWQLMTLGAEIALVGYCLGLLVGRHLERTERDCDY